MRGVGLMQHAAEVARCHKMSRITFSVVRPRSWVFIWALKLDGRMQALAALKARAFRLVVYVRLIPVPAVPTEPNQSLMRTPVGTLTKFNVSSPASHSSALDITAAARL